MQRARVPVRAQAPAAMSRRRFLASAVASSIGLTGARELWLPHSAGAATNATGLTAFRHAMHVHSSFSEGPASLHAQVLEAIASGFDVLHPTDHDWRMSAFGAPDVFHFAGSPEQVAGRTYSWQAGSSGSFAARDGSVVPTPASPYDLATTKGSLSLGATSARSKPATYRFVLDGKRANQSHRTNIGGQTLQLDVYADAVGADGWGELLLTLSYRPALDTPSGSYAAGKYTLSYRFGGAAPSRSAQGIVGIVTVPVPSGVWTPVLIDPESDFAALWPHLVAADNSLSGLALGVTSKNRFAARVHYGNLRFTRSRVTGDGPLVSQQQLIAAYAERHPELQVVQGVEVSGQSEHGNGFFTPRLTDYTQTAPPDFYRYTAELMHAAGGLASINHPLGSGAGSLKSTNAQTALRRKVAGKLLSRQLGGADILETGYRQRMGASLETHLDLTATAWRNGYWVTANGVNDNHSGIQGSWAKEPNRFFTGVWQASQDPVSAYEGLRRGAVFVGELGGFDGFLDLQVDGAGMGMVTVRPDLSTRDLTITGLDLPAGSTVEVTTGPVDYSGAVDPGTVVATAIAASEFSGGTAGHVVDTAASCFVYVTVVASTGRRVAFSNPVYLLREPPPDARSVPDHRRASDSA